MNVDWVVRLPTWLGDTVMALPTLRALDRAVHGHLLLWGPAKYRELLAAAGLDRPYLAYRRRRGPLGVVDVAAAAGRLRRRSPAAALLLPNAFEPALVCALAGVPRRVGYATDGRRPLLTDAIEPPPELRVVHEADRFARLLDRVGLGAPRPGDEELQPTDRMRERGTELLDGAGGLLGLVPGAANDPAKRWPPEHFASLAAAASTRWGAVPQLLGSDSDRAAVEAVRSRCEVECRELLGTGLFDLAAALSRCRVVVSNDTGAAHLAAALGVRTLVLFGPTDPRRTSPRGRRVRAATASVFCQPCLAPRCPLEHQCMGRLSPSRVLHLLAELWEDDVASS